MFRRGSTFLAAVTGILALTSSGLGNDPETDPPLETARAQRVHSNYGVTLPTENDVSKEAGAHDRPGGDVQGPGLSAALTERVPTVFRLTEVGPDGGASPGARKTLVSRPDREIPWYQSGIGALAIVLALVAATAWAVRRWLPSVRLRDNDLLRVVCRVPLSPKQSLALVHLGRRFLVLGIGSDNVNMVCELTDSDEVSDIIRRTETPHNDRSRAFDAALLAEAVRFEDSIVPEYETHRTSASEGRVGRDSLRMLLNRLKALKKN